MLLERLDDGTPCYDLFFDLVVCLHNLGHQFQDFNQEFLGDGHYSLQRITENDVALRRV